MCWSTPTHFHVHHNCMTTHMNVHHVQTLMYTMYKHHIYHQRDTRTTYPPPPLLYRPHLCSLSPTTSSQPTHRLHKTYLAFDGPPFWDTERFWITRVMPPHTPYVWSYFGNFYHAKGQPILYAENQGAYAEKLEGMTLEEVVAEAMVVLREMYGDDIPEPIDAVASGWHTVPTSFGTYSNLPPNTTSKDMEVCCCCCCFWVVFVCFCSCVFSFVCLCVDAC